MKKKIISIITGLSTTMLIIFLLFALFLNFSTLWAIERIKQDTSVNRGYFCAIVSSGSMEPVISVNDLLIIKGAADYKTDDIITYITPKGILVTHRIKQVLNNGYITQGEVNNIPDEDISAQRVMGKVVFIVPGIGRITNDILSPAGIFLLTCIFLIVLLIRKI